MADPKRGERDLRVVLPRIMQLGNLFNRSGLVDRVRESAAIDLDRPELSVLISLSVAGRPLRVGEIAERMQVAGPHVTRTLHGLEKRRLVKGLPDPDDKRARLVELMPDGTRIVERYVTTVFGWFSEALSGWSEKDRDTFYDLLLRFTDDLAAHMAAVSEE